MPKKSRLARARVERTGWADAFHAHARAKGASDLMVPVEVIVVDKLPLLGSGKPDLPAIGRLVATRESATA